MHIKPISNQQNFNGRVMFIKGNKNLYSKVPNQIDSKLNEIEKLVQNKPYDVFIYPSKCNSEFYSVAANKTLEEAKNVKEYTVKISPSIILASITDAVLDAMNMYEKYIAKGIKG